MSVAHTGGSSQRPFILDDSSDEDGPATVSSMSTARTSGTMRSLLNHRAEDSIPLNESLRRLASQHSQLSQSTPKSSAKASKKGKKRIRDPDSDSEVRPSEKHAGESSQTRLTQATTKRARSALKESSKGKNKGSRPGSRDVTPQHAGPSRASLAFVEDSSPGSWSRPVPMIPSRKATPPPAAPALKRVALDETSSLGSWSNPEKLVSPTLPRAREQLPPAPAPPVSFTSTSATVARPTPSTFTSTSKGKGKAPLTETASNERVGDPSFPPSPDADEPAVRRRTIARKTTGGRMPRAPPAIRAVSSVEAESSTATPQPAKAATPAQASAAPSGSTQTAWSAPRWRTRPSSPQPSATVAPAAPPQASAKAKKQDENVEEEEAPEPKPEIEIDNGPNLDPGDDLSGDMEDAEPPASALRQSPTPPAQPTAAEDTGKIPSTTVVTLLPTTIELPSSGGDETPKAKKITQSQAPAETEPEVDEESPESPEVAESSPAVPQESLEAPEESTEMLHPASPEISISDLFVDDDWPTLDGFIPIPVDYEEAEMEEPEPEPESELQQPPELQQESEADTYQRGFETASITTSSSMRSSPDRPVLGTPIRLPVSTPSDDSEAEINDVEFDAALWPSNLTPSSPDPENENEWMLHGEKDTTTFVRNTSGPRTPRAALTKAEEPPPGFKGKARRQPNEECRQFLWEWNNSKDRLSDNPELHSAIFQAFAGMSISHDNMQEADAPEVTVDTSAKAAPPFEFFYSNDVMYHPDVPEPELGAGCGCEGPCDPNNDRCLCAKRQSLYFYTTGLQGFNYDKDGKLRHSECPIWECGPNCGCPPECQNRVIQRGRGPNIAIEIFLTENRGWGIRALAPIPAFTYLGTYAGEVIPDAVSERRGILYDKTSRTYLFDLDGYQVSHPPAGLEEADPRLWAVCKIVEARAAKSGDGAILYSGFSVDALHFGWTRFINHSCNPNLRITQAYVYDTHPERPLLAIFSQRAIAAGEELTISYKGEYDPNAQPSTTSRTPKRGIYAKSTVAHGDGKGRHSRCFCGSKNCNGSMFTWEN